jgi:hypothetical protein
MVDRGQKGTDKLSEAIRRAEESVLKNGKLRDKEAKKEKEKKIRKPIDLDDMLFNESRKQATNPAKQPKQDSGPRIVNFDKQKKLKPKKPEAAIKKPAGRPPPKLSFGELDIGGGSADAPKLELNTEEEKPIEKPIEKPVEKPHPEQPKAELPKAEPPKAKPPEAKPSKAEPSKAKPPEAKPSKAEPSKAKPTERERPSRRKDYDEYIPRRSYARQIKIALIVLLVLATVGAGVFGFLKWRESVDAKNAALQEQINSSSRESLMDDKIKKERFK